MEGNRNVIDVTEAPRSKTKPSEDLWRKRSIRTRSGQYVDPFEPDPDTLIIEDIAHALGQVVRFGGHLPFPYSVAQHSVNTSKLVEGPYKLAALMHDASDAYILDMPRPIKRELPQYEEVEKNLMHVLAKKFGFEFPKPDPVHVADNWMLEIEWSALMLGKRVHISSLATADLSPITPKQASERFLHYYNLYTNGR